MTTMRAPARFEIERVDEGGGVVAVRFEGNLELDEGAALWKELGARLEPTQRGQETRFDLSGVETIDGGAMALLVQKKWDLQSSGARCEFVGTVQKISDMKP